MILLNLLGNNNKVDYIYIGIWFEKVLKEVKCYGDINVVEVGILIDGKYVIIE